jgi:hypothetical protein
MRVRTQRHRQSALHRNLPILLATAFTVLVIWPRALGNVLSALVRLVLLVLIFVELWW